MGSPWVPQELGTAPSPAAESYMVLCYRDPEIPSWNVRNLSRIWIICVGTTHHWLNPPMARFGAGEWAGAETRMLIFWTIQLDSVICFVYSSASPSLRPMLLNSRNVQLDIPNDIRYLSQCLEACTLSQIAINLINVTTKDLACPKTKIYLNFIW